jgi:hypothetical protein
MHRTKTPKEVNKLYKDGEISLKEASELNDEWYKLPLSEKQKLLGGTDSLSSLRKSRMTDKEIKKKALKNILITLSLIICTLLIAPFSNKSFKELSSFNQYQPCKIQFNISDEMLKNYNLRDILLVEFQVSFVIFGFEQDYYLENGLDCRFEKRYSFDETIKNGKYLTFLSRRLVSLSSYALFIFIIWFLIKQFKIIFNSKKLDI